MALATEHEFALMSAWAATLRGWALTALESEEGIAHICQGLAAAQATGAAVQRSNCLALLAEAFGDTRQIAEGLAALEQALAQVHGTGESWWKAELHRLRGELLLRHDVAAEQEAETCFRQAIDIASRFRHQGSEYAVIWLYTALMIVISLFFFRKSGKDEQGI